MSEDRTHTPVYDQDDPDHIEPEDQIIDEKDPAAESTGSRTNYQHVLNQSTGQPTGKVITDDGRVMTMQDLVPPRPVVPGLANPGGGISLDIHFPDIDIDVGDIHAPDLNITEPLLNVDIPQPLVQIDIPEPLVDIKVEEPLLNVEIPQPLLNINIPKPLVDIDITEPLVNAPVDIDVPDIDIDIPDITMPEKIVEIVGPLVPDFPVFPEWPEIPEWPTIPENLVNIVGPMIEIPEDIINIVGPMVEIPEIPEGIVQIGDITMPEIVGIEVDIPLDEIPKPVQYGIAGGAVLIGLGMLLLGAGKTISATGGFTKTITGR